uniref:NB-ARC domain-containing protein n=1 Tax=Fagus sylvatica TaxID=28930 RepID=A0A2N9H4Z2_FAGSY
MARAFVSALAEQLGSIIASEFTLTASVKEDVQKLESKFRTIQAVLNDAEKRQLNEEAVKLWLDKLKDVFYEMDDVLDEWNTAMIKADITKQGKEEESSTAKKRKVWPPINFNFPVPNLFQLRIAHKIKEVNEKVDEIDIEGEMYKFVLTRGSGHEVVERPKTTSFVDVSEICGRDRVKANLGKRFFLVFDDVWTEDYTLWEPFRNALKCGSQGSRILVTTRKSSVAKMMDSSSACMINLEVLSDEDCWLVFSKIAFFDKDNEQCKQLEDLGRKIAKKCKGLPLAVKTLGSLMRFKRGREQWEIVLCSSLWELEDVEKLLGLFAPLLLSYYDLPSPLKRCFSYCAVFPKDYVFSNDELVSMWMAQGYIEAKENMEVEIMAREYFENLAIRSFFQDFEKDADDDRIMRCKMHDIVHDFAQSMTKNECFAINSVIEPTSNYRNARHLHLEIPEEAQYLVSVYSAKNLRTLILDVPTHYNLSNLFQHFRCLRTLILNFPYAELKELPDEIENFIHLRYLNLYNYNAYRLPETICNLCNLQILKISIDPNGRFKKLPQGMDKLINLRHFILEGNIYIRPEVEFPRGIGRLTSLRRLSYFSKSYKDDSKGCNLEELKNLNQLQGSLGIRGLGNVVDVCEVEKAQLKKKIHLRSLDLFFDREYKERMENDALVLNAIEPPPNLEYLRIREYRATTMSLSWMMSLTKLKTLQLGFLEKLELLPSLGKLPFLERLEICAANSLKNVGDEFLGIDSENKRDDKIKIFPNLKYLWFNGLKEWKEWIGIEGMREEEEDSIITIMPCFQELTIWNCPKLKSLPDFLRTNPLKTLVIRNSLILHKCCQRGAGEDWPKISHIPNIEIDGKCVQKDGQGVNDC